MSKPPSGHSRKRSGQKASGPQRPDASEQRDSTQCLVGLTNDYQSSLGFLSNGVGDGEYDMTSSYILDNGNIQGSYDGFSKYVSSFFLSLKAFAISYCRM